MDPTAGEIAGFIALADIADWAGVINTDATDPLPACRLREALFNELGGPLLVREIVHVTRADWDAVVATVTVTPAARPLNAIEKARVE